MKTTLKLISIFSLFALIFLAIATPVQAFDGRSGEDVVIKKDEVISDDVYISANTFTLDGTVKGDLVVFGSTIIINGAVEGDLIAAGQTIVVNGKVNDDARIAGAVLQVGNQASIGGDLVAAGASLEAQNGSKVGNDLVVGAAQALLAGNVTRNVLAGTGALDLRGQIGGDVKAEVGDPNQDAGGPPISIFMPKNEVSVPNVNPGLSISKDAKINGNLEYTQTRKIDIPANVVGGQIKHNKPVIDPSAVVVKPTRAQGIMTWAFNLLRTAVTLIIFGVMLGWLAPAFMKTLIEKVQTQPVASFGWGFVAYAAFFFAILVIIVIMVIGGLIFGALTLGGVSATIVWLGILVIFALVISFVLATAFITKIVVAWLGGKLILSRVKPEMAEHKFAPLILGVALLAVLMALPAIGWLFSLLAVLIGLGAIWLWGSGIWQSKKTAQ